MVGDFLCDVVDIKKMFFKVNILAFPRWITNFRDSLHSKGGVVPAYF